MSLHDDQPLDQKEQGALARSLQLPEHERKEWWAGLPDNTRRAIMQKLINALVKAESPRDIGTLSRSLMSADKLDLERSRDAKGTGTTVNIQNNIDARGNADLVAELRKQMTAGERRALLEALDAPANGNGHDGDGNPSS